MDSVDAVPAVVLLSPAGTVLQAVAIVSTRAAAAPGVPRGRRFLTGPRFMRRLSEEDGGVSPE